ncbi:MAG: hypothetical protein JNJ88_04435 [Planctomycetes bacterium]|nr:hypothetical protein [Planctomycetota bacterium]
MTLAIRRLREEELAAFGPQIAALEHGITYPLGSDRFEIDHGADYFAFFRRMGRVRYYVAMEGEAVEGVLAAVDRVLPGATPLRCTHLCDLKAAPSRRAASSIFRPLLAAFARDPESRLDALYGVSMDSADGSNRLAAIYERMPRGPRIVAKLAIFSLDADEARRAAPVIRSVVGPLSWLSLHGIKDIVLRSTGAPMPLLHAQFGPCASDGRAEPSSGSVHMLCAPLRAPLAAELTRLGFQPTATATALAVGMESVDFSFVLTSEI